MGKVRVVWLFTMLGQGAPWTGPLFAVLLGLWLATSMAHLSQKATSQVSEAVELNIQHLASGLEEMSVATPSTTQVWDDRVESKPWGAISISG